uniref:tRNA pseudouridine synthase n=1 Tax=Heterorhabditis bacteriophora TaxID=37862 RepID=A0A1I7XFB0_HETBA
MTFETNVLLRTAVRRYLLWISYDGSRFPEMAYGGTGFGVMDMLHQVISDSLFGVRPEIQPEHSSLRFSPSSRTDANVHALRNAVICQVPINKSDLNASNSKKKMYLDQWNKHVETIAPGFHNSIIIMKSDPFLKFYRYYTYRLAVARSWEIWNSIQEKPSTVCFSERNYAWCLPPGFQPERAARACNIRRMMSCIVFHGYDRISIEIIQWLLKNPISTNFHDLRIPIAPPQGLFLTDVVYAPEMFQNPIPYHKHSWDYDITTFDPTEIE